MGWGPFGAPGYWGYDMVSPPGPNLLSGPTGLAPCVFFPVKLAGGLEHGLAASTTLVLRNLSIYRIRLD